MRCTGFLIAALLSYSSFAAGAPNLRTERTLNFTLDKEFLDQGNIQYCSEHADGKTIKNISAELLGLDDEGIHHQKDVHVLYYKFAYKLPIKVDSLFENNLYGNSDFMMAHNSRLIGLKMPNPDNPLEQIHTFPEVIGMKGPTIYTVIHTEINNDKKSPYSLTFLNNIQKLYERALGTPRVMATKTLSSNQETLLGATTISYFYALGNESLVVSYKFAVLKPSFKLKLAFGTGIAQLFLAKEGEAIKESVEHSRDYLK